MPTLGLAVACGAEPPDNPFDSAGASSTASTSTSAGATSAGPTGGADETAGGSDAAASSSGGRSPPIFDVGGSDIPAPIDCNCGNDEWSYIWVANANQSTVSKINTETMASCGSTRSR